MSLHESRDDLAPIRDELAELRREVADLRHQVERLTRYQCVSTSMTGVEDTVRFGPADDFDGDSGEPTTHVKRRNLLGVLAAASIGGIGITALGGRRDLAGAAGSSPDAIQTKGIEASITQPRDARPAIYGHTSGSGDAVFGECHNVSGVGSAVLGVSHGNGHAVLGVKPPGAPGDSVVGIGASGAGVHGYSNASAGVTGSSTLGRGGTFSGAKAQIRLIPSTRATHPATGQTGDVFLGSTGMLWLCKESSTWVRLA